MVHGRQVAVLVTQDEGLAPGQSPSRSRRRRTRRWRRRRVHSSRVVRRTGVEVPMTAGRDRWYDELDVPDDPATCPCEPIWTAGPALPHVHVRHDGQAEGDRPHDGRVPRRGCGDPPLHLRPEAGDGRLLVRGRHRLDHGAQLHRLRPALQRGHVRALRGHARLPRPRALVVDRRALRRDDPLHRADRHPGTHEVGPEHAATHDLVAAALGSAPGGRSARAWIWYSSTRRARPVVDRGGDRDGDDRRSRRSPDHDHQPGFPKPFPVSPRGVDEQGERSTGRRLLSSSSGPARAIRGIFGDDGHERPTGSVFPSPRGRRCRTTPTATSGSSDVDDVMNVSGHRIRRSMESALVDHPRSRRRRLRAL